MKIITKNVNDLIPYENNARINDKAIEIVANSIKEFGFKNPVLIDKENIIIAGHTRVEACKSLGIEEVPCIICDDLTEEQVKAFRIADNSTTQIAEWDLEKLQKELGLIDYDMELFGLSDQINSIKEMFEAEAKEDDFDLEANLPKVPESKLGDIYKLRRHYLMCGDSTKKSDVQKLLNGKIVDLVVTDPPYNVNIENETKMKIKNDNMNSEAFENFLTEAFANIFENLKDGGAFYIWYAILQHIPFENALTKNNLKVRQQLIWNKNHFSIGRADYQWKHEPCFYGWKEGNHYFTDDRTFTTVFEDLKKNFAKMKKEELVKYCEELTKERFATTILDEKKPVIDDEHPTMKPVALFGKLIANSSRPNETVLDLFGGSGTTIIACEQLNRTAYVMEYDPIYCDAILKRWEQFSGIKAEKIN